MEQGLIIRRQFAGQHLCDEAVDVGEGQAPAQAGPASHQLLAGGQVLLEETVGEALFGKYLPLGRLLGEQGRCQVAAGCS